MKISLIDHIKRFVELSSEEEEIILRLSKSASYKRKEFLLFPENICRSLLFVEKGCLRMFFVNSKSVEQITQFAIDGWWLSDFFSFMDKKPSEYFIQTVESSKIISIDREMFDQLLKEIPHLEKYFRIIMQKNLAASQLRIKYLYEMSKEEFYFHFVNNYPDFVQRVPQYMIASFLGLTPEYVSELRNKK